MGLVAWSEHRGKGSENQGCLLQSVRSNCELALGRAHIGAASPLESAQGEVLRPADYHSGFGICARVVRYSMACVDGGDGV